VLKARHGGLVEVRKPSTEAYSCKKKAKIFEVKYFDLQSRGKLEV